MIYFRVGQLVRNQEQHFLLGYRKEPYHTHGQWAHITSSLPHSYTYICSARFISNITHQMTTTVLNTPFNVMHVI